jgi:hypothetical protein
MALLSKDSGGEGFEPIPAGTYVARCVSVIDLGVQETPWGGKEKVYIGFEIPGERVQWKDKDGKEHEGPAFIGSRYTNSINEKAILGQHLTSWRGVPFTDDERQGFDLFTILGVPAMINVTHKKKDSKVYANITSIMRLPKGMECPPAETELVGYSPMDNDRAGNFDKLLDWQKDLVRKGYQMAEGDNTIGSANRQSAPTSSARDQALAAAHGTPPQHEETPDDFYDDIPF